MYWKGGMGDGGGCLVGGQYVYTIDGMKKIEDVEQGDMVLNGKGAYSQVESISARDYDGGVSRLFPRGLPAIELTDEHPVLVADDLRKKYTWREKTMHDGRHPVNDAIGEPYYLPASEVNTDHYVLFPMPVSGSRQKDETYEVLAGYYLSEGTVEWRQDRGCYGRVAFHFHERELEYQENVCNLVAALSLKGVVKHTKNHCAVLRVHDPKLAARLDNDFGHGASTKVLPAWVLDGSQGTAENILRGMFRGDGSSHRYGYTFSTTSRDLAFGAHLLLKRLRIPSRIKEHGARFNGCDHRRSWDVVVSNARDLQRMSAIVGMPLKHKMQAKRYEHVFERGGQFYHKVRKVERFATKQKVYNLEMREAEPSFVTVAGTVHNCHPKENMALSYLARSIGLSFDWFGMNMECREAETEWLATLLEDAAQAMNKSEVWLIGMAFKAGVTQLHGSAAVLLKNILEDRGLVKVRVHDPIIGMGEELPSDAIVGLISCNHTLFTTYQWHKGSMILDPWRYLAECDEVLPIGRV
jgi:intein/homing endonuclease